MNNLKHIFFLIALCFSLFVNTTKGQDAITISLNPTDDVWIRMSLNPSYTYLANTTFNNIIFNHCNEWTIGGYRITDRAVMKFDFSMLPEGAEIESAKLSLYAHDPQPNDNYMHVNFTTTSNTGYKLNACYLERITENWDPTTVTWNTQPATSSDNRDTLFESFSINQSYTDVDVTNMVKDMISNANTINPGIMMRLINEEKYARMSLCSLEEPDPAKHPKLVIKYLLKKDKVFAGYNHSAMIKRDGTVWTWGTNSYGELGVKNIYMSFSPIQVVSTTNPWVEIAATYDHTLAIKSDGTLWAWGQNWEGQLGDGTKIEKYEPVQIGTDTDWKVVATGMDQSFAIKKNGTLWAWGANSVGQLGDGTLTSKIVPVQIGTEKNWKEVKSGYFHTLAIKKDGTLWAWGFNTEGQVGDGSVALKRYPTKISTATWEKIAAGSAFSAGIQTDGTLWMWGDNWFGQLGTGDNTKRLVPTNIAPEIQWTDISLGNNHSVAYDRTGSLWTWGSNEYGTLGDGTNINKYTPQNINLDGEICTSVGTGFEHTIILKSNKNYCSAGMNYTGQLGDGTDINKNLFVCNSYSSSLKSAKINSIQPSTNKQIPANEVSSQNTQLKSQLLKCYPNPAKNSATISYYLAPEIGQARIVIHGLYNNSKIEYPVTDKGNSYITLDISSFPAGIYSYSLIVDGQIVNTQKLVVVK